MMKYTFNTVTLKERRLSLYHIQETIEVINHHTRRTRITHAFNTTQHLKKKQQPRIKHNKEYEACTQTTYK